MNISSSLLLFIWFSIFQARTMPRSTAYISGAAGNIFLIFVALAFAGLIIFCVIAVVISLNRKSDRTAKLRMVAQQLGFSYTQKPSVPDFLLNTMFAQRSPLAVGGGMNNLLQGNINNIPVLIFDFGYTLMFGRITQTHRQTVICIPRGTNSPFILYRDNVMVEPENFRTFIDEALKALN